MPGHTATNQGLFSRSSSAMIFLMWQMVCSTFDSGPRSEASNMPQAESRSGKKTHPAAATVQRTPLRIGDEREADRSPRHLLAHQFAVQLRSASAERVVRLTSVFGEQGRVKIDHDHLVPDFLTLRRREQFAVR